MRSELKDKIHDYRDKIFQHQVLEHVRDPSFHKAHKYDDSVRRDLGELAAETKEKAQIQQVDDAVRELSRHPQDEVLHALLREADNKLGDLFIRETGDPADPIFDMQKKIDTKKRVFAEVEDNILSGNAAANDPMLEHEFIDSLRPVKIRVTHAAPPTLNPLAPHATPEQLSELLGPMYRHGGGAGSDLHDASMRLFSSGQPVAASVDPSREAHITFTTGDPNAGQRHIHYDPIQRGAGLALHGAVSAVEAFAKPSAEDVLRDVAGALYQPPIISQHDTHTPIDTV